MANPVPSLDLSFLRDRAVRRRIAAVTLACALAGVAYALLAPKWHRSAVTVVPVKAQRGGGASRACSGGDAAGLSAGFLQGASIGGADVAKVAVVLQSTAVSDAVIE